jgi:Zn-dependent protease with chaperone function
MLLTAIRRGSVLILGAPLGLWVILLVLGLVYRESLDHAGLNPVFRYALSLVPMGLFALLLGVHCYLNLRDPGGDGEPAVSRADASQLAISTTLLLVVFPLVPFTILLFRGRHGFDFTTVILIAVSAVGLQLVIPRLTVFVLGRDRAREEKLRERVQGLARTAGVSVGDVFVSEIDEDEDDDDDDDDGCVAFACGLGRSRRVVISGEMVELLAPEELDAIVAHEFAHVRERHVAKTIAVTFALAMGLAALELLPGSDTFWGVLLFAVAFALCVLIKLAFDRRFEVTADQRAADWAGAGNLRNALAKIGALEKPSRLPSWLGTHPPMTERIRCAESRMG